MPSNNPKTYSILMRVRRTIHEDGYVAVPVDESITRINEDGSFGIDPEALIMEAIRLAGTHSIQWQIEESTIQPHPIQQPLPEERKIYDPITHEKHQT